MSLSRAKEKNSVSFCNELSMQPDTQPTQNTRQQLHDLCTNNEVALKLLYQTNYPKVEKYVLNNGGTTAEAKDVFQEAFIALWRNVQLERVQLLENTGIDAYLFRVAKNKWIDHLRASRRQPFQALTEAHNDSSTDQLQQHEHELLHTIGTALQTMMGTCREVLERFYFHRQSLHTIADAMEWTEATARNNKYRCLQQLRKLVKAKCKTYDFE